MVIGWERDGKHTYPVLFSLRNATLEWFNGVNAVRDPILYFKWRFSNIFTSEQ
jgi:hypothetical protein